MLFLIYDKSISTVQKLPKNLFDLLKNLHKKYFPYKIYGNSRQISNNVILCIWKEVFYMLKKFEVSNYKGFQAVLSWDLSATRDYAYKKGLVENKIVKKSVIPRFFK